VDREGVGSMFPSTVTCSADISSERTGTSAGSWLFLLLGTVLFGGVLSGECSLDDSLEFKGVIVLTPASGAVI
jgi:hypothetical protein